MKDKDIFDEISRQMDEALARGDTDFNEAMKRAQDLFERAKKTVPNNPDHILVRLSGKRFTTFFKLIGCAIEILLTGRTAIQIRRKKSS